MRSGKNSLIKDKNVSVQACYKNVCCSQRGSAEDTAICSGDRGHVIEKCMLVLKRARRCARGQIVLWGCVWKRASQHWHSLLYFHDVQ